MFRSKLEERVSGRMPEGSYEPWKMDYSVPHSYTPDFVVGNIVYEVKGFFRAGDTQRYKAIHKQLILDGFEFRFILQNPNKVVSKGAKLTMAKWCTKQGIFWEKA